MSDHIHVLSKWSDGRLCAYLYGFAIDKYDLQTEHKTFLTRTAAEVLVQWSARGSKAQDFCQFWLHGTTSRSASVKHNSLLSERRSSAVRTYLEGELRQGRIRVPSRVVTTGLTETVALLTGKRDGSEDPLDRAVILVAQWFSVPNPQPPVIQRPSPRMLPNVYKNFLIRAVWGKADALPVDRKGRVSAQNIVMNIEIMDVILGESAMYTFDGTGPLIDFTPDKLQPEGKGLTGTTGRWHRFWVLSGGAFKERRCDDFAGPALFEEYAIATKSWAGFYFEQLRDMPFKYAVSIRDFDTGLPSEIVAVSGGAAPGRLKLTKGRQPVATEPK
jgi:hypothetical protein